MHTRRHKAQYPGHKESPVGCAGAEGAAAAAAGPAAAAAAARPAAGAAGIRPRLPDWGHRRQPPSGRASVAAAAAG